MTGLALAEPGTRVHYYLPRTTFRRDDDVFVVNGEKAFVASGGRRLVRAERDAEEFAATRGAADPPAGRCVIAQVADSGPGIDDRTLARVFEPFFSTQFAGRGLGLAASHGIARAHGGALVAESEPGLGATFTLLLPIDGGT